MVFSAISPNSIPYFSELHIWNKVCQVKAGGLSS